MWFAPRARLSALAQLCRRLAIALEAGLDIRRVMARESQRQAPRAQRQAIEHVASGVASGSTLGDALAESGDYFPPLFHELVQMGEATGKTAEVFRHLAEHYDHQLRLRQTFLASLTWPAVQLVAALGVVGMVIWLTGVIAPASAGGPIDILGFGLVGTRGLVIYLCVIATLAVTLATLVIAASRGAFWVAPVERLTLLIPMLGKSLRTLALARFAWTLQLTLDTGMELGKALTLAFRGTRLAEFQELAPTVANDVRRGLDVHDALSATEAFPPEFLDAIDVGERSGRLPETMVIISKQYQQRAQQALAVLTTLAGFAVWALVALLIILLIVRVFMFYLGTIQDALADTY